MEISRTKANEYAFVCIYDYLTYRNASENDIDIKRIISNICDEDYENCDVIVKDITVQAIIHEQEIISDVSNYMKNWSYNRLDLITKAIILFAYSNFKYGKNADKPTVIDSAVKYAKKYGDGPEYKFINAVLDRAL